MISLTLAASLLKGAINLQLCAELTRVVVLRGYNRSCKCFTEYCGQWVCMNCRGLIRFIGGKSVVVWRFCTQHIVLALFPASLPPCPLPPCPPAPLPPCLPASLAPCLPASCVLFFGFSSIILRDMASLQEDKSLCAFGAAVCKIQARKGYTESFPPVPKDKRSCFSPIIYMQKFSSAKVFFHASFRYTLLSFTHHTSNPASNFKGLESKASQSWIMSPDPDSLVSVCTLGRYHLLKHV